ncbi:uncharacterized protein PHALS_03013 [Plasmopara halstedii]|uniref:Uncharacterized protein n=1 Tax=Plasmopara halstedii TaxID=4781 RepID=A0A0P1A8H5_PLAHL|nr:uncharacterized protein PHALS_03013 [Plasmopara halstedii]CEG36464.1 hypothetical protein PHALS_03013 [Plasmopara halstedii]|eukprot:XP_024572833.1 hypothetical protein PHALS_03013 [Plasmopara halstedii]
MSEGFFCGSWPTATEFVNRFIHGLLAMELRGSIPHLLCLCRDLTAIIRSIVGAQGVLHGPVQFGDLTPPVGFVSDGVVHRFPELSTRDSTLSTIVQAFKELRQIALPVYSDLQFRLA